MRFEETTLEDLCEDAGWRHVVTESHPPRIRLTEGGRDHRLEGGFALALLKIPNPADRAQEAIRRLALVFDVWGAREVLERAERDIARENDACLPNVDRQNLLQRVRSHLAQRPEDGAEEIAHDLQLRKSLVQKALRILNNRRKPQNG